MRGYSTCCHYDEGYEDGWKDGSHSAADDLLVLLDRAAAALTAADPWSALGLECQDAAREMRHELAHNIKAAA